MTRATTSRPAAGSAAFTLVEMLVAVAVVAILTIGIGQIFASVSKLVGTGAAVAEVDQMARTVESQMRDDFNALNAMEADKTFVAIRNTRLGDFNLDGTFAAGEGIDLYLTQDDEQADRRDSFLPYERGPNGEARSRAVTVRLDEIAFIGASKYYSFQSSVPQDGNISADLALISYGHALRPPLQSEVDADPYKPRRLNYADGYFGSHAGDDNRFSPNMSADVTGRNRYAADFVLSRQALLLKGPGAFGQQRSRGPAGNDIFYPAPMGYNTEIAVYVRDLESSVFFGGTYQADDLARFPLGAWPPTYGPVMGGYPNWAISKPTVIRHGRTDICAMDRAGVQRWLEGGIFGGSAFDGVPFDEGSILFEFQQNLPNPNSPNNPNAPLWRRAFVPPPLGTPAMNIRDAYLFNLRGIQSAIAGTLCRPLVETEPPDLRIGENDYAAPIPDPTDRRMDVHAVLAEHCSSFEVAWSDGSRWDGGTTGLQTLEVDTDGDGTFERTILPGDVLWFDMDFTYRDFWDVLAGSPERKEARYPRPNPDPEMGLERERVFEELPLVNDSSTQLDRTLRSSSDALNIVEDQNFLAGGYSRTYTQGRDADNGAQSRNTIAEQEYMAIWGFRPPLGYDRDLTQAVATTGEKGAIIGEYAKVAWTKPQLIRVRVTLHDSQNRLPGGKTYQFIFRVNLK